MHFALLIYESPEAFATRKAPRRQSHLGAWRAYDKAVVGPASMSVATHLRCRRRDHGAAYRREAARTGWPLRRYQGAAGGNHSPGPPLADAALDWAARCPAASMGAMEVRPLAPEARRRITG